MSAKNDNNIDQFFNTKDSIYFTSSKVTLTGKYYTYTDIFSNVTEYFLEIEGGGYVNVNKLTIAKIEYFTYSKSFSNLPPKSLQNPTN